MLGVGARKRIGTVLTFVAVTVRSHFHSSNHVFFKFNISIEVLYACVNIKMYGLSDSEAEIIIISKKCDFFISAILKSRNGSHIEVSGGGSYQKCEVEVISSMWEKKMALLSGMSTSILKQALRYLTIPLFFPLV